MNTITLEVDVNVDEITAWSDKLKAVVGGAYSADLAAAIQEEGDPVEVVTEFDTLVQQAIIREFHEGYHEWFCNVLQLLGYNLTDRYNAEGDAERTLTEIIDKYPEVALKVVDERLNKSMTVHSNLEPVWSLSWKSK